MTYLPPLGTVIRSSSCALLDRRQAPVYVTYNIPKISQTTNPKSQPITKISVISDSDHLAQPSVQTSPLVHIPQRRPCQIARPRLTLPLRHLIHNRQNPLRQRDVHTHTLPRSVAIKKSRRRYLSRRTTGCGPGGFPLRGGGGGAVLGAVRLLEPCRRILVGV